MHGPMYIKLIEVVLINASYEIYMTLARNPVNRDFFFL